MYKLKTATQAIVELAQENHYKPLKNILYTNDFLKLLSSNHQSLISKFFIKNDKLFILVKHHIALQELKHDNTKKSFKILIKIYANKYPESNFDKIKDIIIFIDKFYPIHKNIKIYKKSSYFELSKGEFINPFEKNNILFNKFENLRKIIINNAHK